MEAICKADYDTRVKVTKEAEKRIEELKKAGKPTDGIKVDPVGYQDIYGVWFFGTLKEAVLAIAKDRFSVDLGNRMHVFVDEDPKKIVEGVHDILVYEKQCKFYKWKAQGYHRGLVVLANDVTGNRGAEVFQHSKTWSFELNEEYKALLFKATMSSEPIEFPTTNGDIGVIEK